MPDAFVVVVGAGPVGLVSALLLAARGVPSVVLERRREPFGLPRAVHLDDETVRILQGLDLADAFLGISRPALGLRILDADHRVVAEFARRPGAGRFGFPPANLFDQPDLEALLRARVASSPLVTLRPGCEVVAVDPGGPAIHFVDHQGRPSEYRPAAVLGCDGANGMVRAAIGAGETDLGRSEHWLVVDVRTARTLGTWDGVHQVSDPVRAATYMQVGADRYRWEFRIAPGEDAARLTRPEILGELLRPWTGSSSLAGLEVLRSADYRYAARMTGPWRRGRVFLLGDAAHQTPPFIGQGLGAGLRDAANLTWKLAAVLTGGAGDDLLASYAVERAPHVRTLIRQALLLSRIMTGGGRAAGWLRRPLLLALGRVPGVPALLDRGSPALRPGPLVAPRRHPGAVPGRLLPQPVLTGAGSASTGAGEAPPRRLDDILGPGFVVLSRSLPSLQIMETARRLGAPLVRADELDDGGVLTDWLRAGRADAVVVRPDRTVLAAADRRGRLRGSQLDAVQRCLDLIRPRAAAPSRG